MLPLDREALETITGGAGQAPSGRTWGGVVRDYGLACGEGALQASLMTGAPTPYTLGVGCAAGMAGQGLSDAIQAYRGR